MNFSPSSSAAAAQTLDSSPLPASKYGGNSSVVSSGGIGRTISQGSEGLTGSLGVEEDSNAALLKDLADLIDEQSEIANKQQQQQQQQQQQIHNVTKESAMIGGGGGGPTMATNPFSKMSSIVPKELLGPLVMEALNGFMFLVNESGRIDIISDNVSGFLGRSQMEMEGSPVYSFIHPGDHSRFRFSLIRGLEGGSMGGGDSFLKSKVFTVRFARQPERSDSANAVMMDGNPDVLKYETMQVSAVPIKASDTPKIVEGRDLSGSRLFCVARKVSRSERNQHFPVEQFTSKLDTNSNFNIIVLDTTGMDQIHATSITRVMLNHSLLEFVHPEDKEVLSNHLSSCLKDGTNVSPVYRMNLLGNKAEFVHVKTKSRFFKACLAAGNPSDFMNCTHSIIGETELRRSDLPGSRYQQQQQQQQQRQQQLQQQQQQSPSPVISNNLSSGSSSQPEMNLSPPNNNNLVKNPNSAAAASSMDSDSQQKNLLLKELLNVNFSRKEEESRGLGLAAASSDMSVGSSSNNSISRPNSRTGPPPSPPSSSNSRILQLLNKRNDSVPRATSTRPGVLSPISSSSSVNSAPSPNNNNPPPSTGPGSNHATSPALSSALQIGVKRPASSLLASSSPSSSISTSSLSAAINPEQTPKTTSTVCKQNPSLTNLLSKPPHNSTAVPPPVPTKWHQEPREKLPRTEEGLKQFFPPHPAERSASLSTSSSSSSPTTNTNPVHLQPRASSAGPSPNNTSSSSSGIASSSNSCSNGAGNVTSDGDLNSAIETLNSDPVLSEILDGVIEIQEKSPTSVASSVSTSSRFIKIETIEKFLTSGEGTGNCSSSSSAATATTTTNYNVGSRTSSSISSQGQGVQTSSSVSLNPLQQQQQQQPNYHRSMSVPQRPGNVVVTSGGRMNVMSGGLSGAAVGGGLGGQLPPASPGSFPQNNNNNNNNVIRGRNMSGGNPVSLVPRMNELLQVVPPNVSITERPDLGMMQQQQQQHQRQRIASGPIMSNSTPSSRISSSPGSVTSSTSSSNSGPGAPNLLMQQLNAGPLNQQPQSQQQQRAMYNNFNSFGGNMGGGGGMRNNGFNPVQQQQQQQQPVMGVRYPQQQMQRQHQQPSPQQQRLGGPRQMLLQQQMMGGGGPPQHQQQQQQQPHFIQQQQQQQQQQNEVDENRSLLQQLLSE